MVILWKKTAIELTGATVGRIFQLLEVQSGSHHSYALQPEQTLLPSLENRVFSFQHI